MPTVLALFTLTLSVTAGAAEAPRRTTTAPATGEESTRQGGARGTQKTTPGVTARAKEEPRPWVSLAAGPAFPFARGPVWPRAHLRLGLPLVRLDERFTLSLVVPLSTGWARQTGTFSATSTVLAFDLIPSARLSARGPGRLSFYGDMGVGVAHFRYGFELPGLGQARDHTTGLGLRVGAGLAYDVSHQWGLFLEPLHLLFHTAREGVFRFGNTSFSSSTGAGPQASVLAGASYSW
ncbi:hypothetical protein [Archangium sp.]|uniref:outer membrane protein n=1 Tax=Archangium sp. TaxID=1872627 RepID=UPI002869F40A|nr:hypothetical protein [Archangium sp.]